MGDLPEPKKHVLARETSMKERFLPQDLISRKDRRLSHMVGLDQVKPGLYAFWILPNFVE